VFINGTLSYSFQSNSRSNSWLLLPIDIDEKEKNEIRKKNKGLMKKKKIVNKDTFAKNPTDRSTSFEEKTRKKIFRYSSIFILFDLNQ
jgi:hypothetical protein